MKRVLLAATTLLLVVTAACGTAADDNPGPASGSETTPSPEAQDRTARANDAGTRMPTPTPKPCTGYQGPPGTSMEDREAWALSSGDYSESIPRTGKTSIEDVLDVQLEITPDPVPCTAIARLTIRVTNASSDPIELRLPHAHQDFVVMNEGGSQIWRWLAGMPWPPARQDQLGLAPGESKEFFSLWQTTENDGSPAEPGAYGVRGFFRAELASEPVREDGAWVATEKRTVVVATPPPSTAP